MEELPIQNAEVEIESPPEVAVDPEKLGKVSLLFEDLPPPEQPPPIIFPQPAERNPKLLLSRKKLRAKIDNYKKQKQEQTPEVMPETDNETGLSEVEFDRRREAIDEKTRTNRVAEGMVAIGEVLKESPTNSPASVLDSTQPKAFQPTSSPPALVPNPQPMSSYKKALAFGMATGIVVALLLIFLYVK